MANLADFTFFNNRSLGGVTNPNDARAQAALRAIQQYDSNASYRPDYGSDGQLLGYTLDVDASKLPGASGQGNLGGSSGHGSGADFMPSFSTVQPNMHLANQSATFDSPLYGKVTDNRNIVQDDDWIAKWGGPALVALFSMGIGGLAAAMSNGALGAASSAGSAGGLGSWGMGDHGLGVAGGAGADGTLSAADIAGLGSTASANGIGVASDLPGGLGGGAADELANGGQYVAGAPAASQTSIDVSNWLAAHGLPTQLGLSDGAVGAALSEPGFGLSSFAKPIASLAKIPGLLGGGTASGGGAGGLLAGGSGGGAPGATMDALALLRAFYGDPTITGMQYLAQQRHGLLNG